MVDVEKCPYIEYKIQGISGIVAKEEKNFCVKDDLIIQIGLKQEGLEITGLKVLLKEDSVIDEQVKQTVRRKIERFLVNLYGNPNVYVSKFSMGIHPVQIGLGIRNFRLNLKNVCTDSVCQIFSNFCGDTAGRKIGDKSFAHDNALPLDNFV